MVRDINGLGGYPSAKPNTDQGSNKKTTAADSNLASSSVASSSVASSTPVAASGTNEVQLSPEAKTLQALADKVNHLPEANLERAEQIKAALQRGEYKIDDLVVAEKLLNSEALFGK